MTQFSIINRPSLSDMAESSIINRPSLSDMTESSIISAPSLYKDHVRWDLASNMPITHLTFILKCFMSDTNHVIALSKEFVHNRESTRKQMEQKYGTNDSCAQFVGSIYDGLMMPPVYKRHGFHSAALQNELDFCKGWLEWGDMDMFTVVKGKYVGNVDQPCKEEYRYHMDMTDTSPGYLQLTHVDSSMTGPYILNVDHKAYFSSEKMMKDMIDKAECGFLILMKQATVERNGPAVTIKHLTEPGQREVDNVMGLACPVWPKQVQEWCSRNRPSGWPPESLRNNIIAGGTHVVPVAHKNSKWPEVEWRLSFVLSEQKLAKSLNVAQRQCYLTLKTLMKHELSPPSLLSSYCLKNHLFQCMEKIPEAVWKDENNGLGTAFLYMLDQLIYALTNANLPHYFLPSNNLIGHIPRDFLHELAAKVCQLRRNPVEYMVSFNKNFICSTPREVSLGAILKPVLIHSSMQYHFSSIHCYTAQYISLVLLCHGFMSECNFPAGYAVSKAACHLGKQIGYIIEPITFIDKILLTLEHPMTSMHGFEYLESRFGELPLHFLSSMARMYTTMYTRLAPDTDDPAKNDYKQKAERMFKKLLNLEENHTGVIVDHAIFLRKCGSSSQAISSLLEVVKEGDEKCHNKYGQLERYATDVHLQREIRQMGSIEAPTLVFAYYQLVQCYIETGEVDKAKQLMPNFSHFCHQYKEDDITDIQMFLCDIESLIRNRTSELPQNIYTSSQGKTNSEAFRFSLLGYAYLDLGDYDSAKQAFCEALHMKPDYKMASDNQMICHAKLKIKSK